MKPTLVILAAGMASRYGGNKQIDGFGPNNETILEYSIYDAIRAGFGKVCFIIRDEHQEIFEEKFAKHIKDQIEVVYAFQGPQLEEYGFNEHMDRAKPWGTGHALLAARNVIGENFCVINADDFYSLTAFKQMAEFLSNEATDKHFALLGYTIGKTLSDSGPVTRGVCAVSDNGKLERLDERAKVYRNAERIIEFVQADGKPGTLPENALVSMNFWGFTPAIFSMLEPLFKTFVKENKENPKAEFLIPEAAQQLLQEGKASFSVLAIDAPCFGVTYQEDKPLVREELANLVAEKVYPANLWNGVTV
ncbi:nucleotidyltransferase family protein [Olivibacter domesticus]|uniref:dTDP-glucose pyrophosphorylase n=1 Tax=Olivibacter domesticus TaxID=407022 RepID=A0A1H7ZUH7_OLID1|nr:sugar phosphate nucleotidyltransferase [Olivibacter domesticus]SEM62282.1 dTDP-glucose pyrophosphorylase [Olivibacter domesticus]